MTDDEDQKELTDEEQTDVAIEWFYAMWEEAGKRGVGEEKMTIVSLSAVLNRMIKLYGEDGTAELVKDLPEKILAGNFSTPPDVKQ